MQVIWLRAAEGPVRVRQPIFRCDNSYYHGLQSLILQRIYRGRRRRVSGNTQSDRDNALDLLARGREVRG